MLQAYDDSGVRALLGFAMMDKPMVDNFPFVDELLPPGLAADLRAAPRPSAGGFIDLMNRLVLDRHPQQRRVGVTAGLSKPRGDDGPRWLSAKEAWHAGTLAGGRALGFGDTLGSLKVGSRADLVGYRLDHISLTPLNDPLRQLAYAERGAGVDFVMADGDGAMRGGRLTQIDEAALLDEIACEFHDLADRYAHAESNAAPVIAAMEAIYRRSLGLPVPADAYPARIAALNPGHTARSCCSSTPTPRRR